MPRPQLDPWGCLTERPDDLCLFTHHSACRHKSGGSEKAVNPTSGLSHVWIGWHCSPKHFFDRARMQFGLETCLVLGRELGSVNIRTFRPLVVVRHFNHRRRDVLLLDTDALAVEQLDRKLLADFREAWAFFGPDGDDAAVFGLA